MEPGKESERNHATAEPEQTQLSGMDKVPDDVLLEVFDHYRLASGYDWSRPRRWYRLVHVCRRWRLIVLASSLRLNLQLRCTFGTQVEDMITHSPPFPLVLKYEPHHHNTWTTQDEEGTLFALQHLERAHEIILIAPEHILTRLTSSMTEAAPLLKYLELRSQTKEVVLPGNFLGGAASQIQHMKLAGAALRTLEPLLSHTTTLLTLALERIPSSVYVSPENLIERIRSMPQLRTLSISFLSTTPRPPLHPPSHIQRVELPMLRRLEYRGVSAYLEAFLARIQIPRLNYIYATLFNQLTFSMWHTSEFFRSVESFKPLRARMEFSKTSAHIILTAQPQPYQFVDATLRVPCTCFDFQVSAMSQICSALHETLHLVEGLTLTFHGGELPEEWQNEVDLTLWRDLLSPFQCVKTLGVSATLGTELGRALEPGEEDGPVAELLPELLSSLYVGKMSACSRLHMLPLIHSSMYATVLVAQFK
ncbi:hypothetical protein B0F90DRAFT_168421 [Multifurca ochricompacta]|uniref:F-box domain-containing protein n=1 Tax=Multifurca ochricompacta TaxID=376703 RepID=A0AAD4QPF5_9AGAM|nr:hypothetical protein B0F90DRAFT_168421 [Multifurca ochricompacta]